MQKKNANTGRTHDTQADKSSRPTQHGCDPLHLLSSNNRVQENDA